MNIWRLAFAFNWLLWNAVMGLKRVGTHHGSGREASTEQFKNLDHFKRVLIYHDDEVWPRPDSRATIRLSFTGSFQDSVQQLPHVCLRVRWPLGGNAPGTIFDSEGNATNFQVSEAHWFPNHFDLWARPLTAQEQEIIVRSGVPRSDKTWGALDFARTTPGVDRCLKGVMWPCPNMHPAFVPIFKGWFRDALRGPKMTLFIQANQPDAILD